MVILPPLSFLGDCTLPSPHWPYSPYPWVSCGTTPYSSEVYRVPISVLHFLVYCPVYQRACKIYLRYHHPTTLALSSLLADSPAYDLWSLFYFLSATALLYKLWHIKIRIRNTAAGILAHARHGPLVPFSHFLLLPPLPLPFYLAVYSPGTIFCPVKLHDPCQFSALFDNNTYF